MAETYPAEIRTVERTIAVFAGVVTKGGNVVLDFLAGSLIEAKRFALSPGRFGGALGRKELPGELAGGRDPCAPLSDAIEGRVQDCSVTNREGVS